jgi:hypothetical protein
MKYMGSPSSNQMDWYTEGLSIRNWWKNKIKTNPESFLIDIIEVVNTDSPQFLVEIEKNYHIDLNVKYSLHYFNKSIATCGWVSAPRTDHTKKLVSEKTSEYWNSTTAGLEKKKRLVERNKTIHSDKMKYRWANPTESMKTRFCPGRPKGAKDLSKRRPRFERKVFVEGIVYDSAKLAALKMNIHPATVRRKCKSPIFLEWRYIE